MRYQNTPASRVARLTIRAGAVASALMLVYSSWTSLAPALAASLEGPAQVVTPGSTGGAPLAAGDSDTDFTLKLPTGAACAGDSANDEWRWQTYIVPQSTDPATLQFGNQSPTNPGTGANFTQALYTNTGSPVTNQQTADKTPPSNTGPIINIPAMDFAVWGPGDIGPGTYNVGIACTKGPASTTQLDRFWNTTMTFTTAASGQGGPARVTWTSAAAPASTTTTAPGTGATTTTTSAAGGPTTTTASAGATTTTTSASGGATTTTLVRTTTSVASFGTTATTSEATTFSANANIGGSGIARTGTDSRNPVMWAGLLILFGSVLYALGVQAPLQHGRRR